MIAFNSEVDGDQHESFEDTLPKKPRSKKPGAAKQQRSKP